MMRFKIRFTLGDGRQIVREAKAGDMFYGDDILHSPLNIGDPDASGILVEMKQPAAGLDHQHHPLPPRPGGVAAFEWSYSFGMGGGPGGM